jgi:hypothetical protein
MSRLPDIRDNRVPLARTVVYEVSGGPP